MELLKISELIALLQKAQDQFGDMPVGAYSADYCYELGKKDDLMGVSLRVMTDMSGASAQALPGLDLSTDEEGPSSDKFLTIFYLDQ
jgi:hypothetical protein